MDPRTERFNTCAVEMSFSIFQSFEAGFANAIPASNDEKYYYLWKLDISQIEFFDEMITLLKLFLSNFIGI